MVFQGGNLVFLKVQPYRQKSLARCSNEKLSLRYFGPYQIVQKEGKVAYELALPKGSLIHPVFHVSQLKKLKVLIKHPLLHPLCLLNWKYCCSPRTSSKSVRTDPKRFQKATFKTYQRRNKKQV